MNNPTLEACDRLAEIKLKLDDEYNRISWLLDEAEDDVRWLINELEQSIPKERLDEWLSTHIDGLKTQRGDFSKGCKYSLECLKEAITSGSMEGKG